MKILEIIELTLLLSFVINTANSQTSFSLLIKTPLDERVFDSAEDEFSNYFLVGHRYNANTNIKCAYLLAINKTGEIFYEHDYCSENINSYFGSIYSKNDSLIIFGAKGPNSSTNTDSLWILILDSNFNILKDKAYFLSGYNLVDIESIINQEGDYVLNGVICLPEELPDMLFYKLSPSGDSLLMSILSYEMGQFSYDLIEKPEGGYKIFSNGNFPGSPQAPGLIVEVDTLFNYLGADSIPNGLFFNHSAKWVNDSVYLITGNEPIYDPSRTDIGIIKINTNDELILGNHFGKIGDTISYVGASSNLDFLTSGNIFFGGASNIFPSHLMFQPEDSWLLLNNLDSNLNLNWQKFYGGDACYYLWGLKATQDGGCLMLATRYDENTQNEELDIYILKVDSSGLLTSTDDDIKIHVLQLAILPNPAQEIVFIRYPEIFGNDEKEIEVINSLGMPVFKLSAAQDLIETSVNVSALPAGLYFVVLKVEGKKVATGKLIKI